MTTSIRSPGISFELERYCILRGKDDVCHTLVKTNVKINQVRQISTLSNKLRPVHASLQNSKSRVRHVQTQHLAPSSMANPHSNR